MRRALLVLAPAVLAAQATPPAFDAEVKAGYATLGKGEYLAARNAFAAAAFDDRGRARDEGAFQSWLQFSPMVTGELPPDAMLRRAEVSPPDAAAAEAVRGATAHDAVAEIVARAKRTRIVILNEAHWSPRDRAFAWEVARALRPLGYRYLAAETFSPAQAGMPDGAERLARDGFVRLNTGAYSKDPVFAGYLRQAVAIGYLPVAYEQRRDQYGDGSGGMPAREAAQTANLMTAIFAHDPAAKVLIHVGHSHLAEAPLRPDDSTDEWMALRLKRATGVDPLTIDQTTLTDLAPAMRAAYPLAVAKLRGRPGVLFRGGRPLVVGQYAGAVDLQVVHPARAYREGRPTWLRALGGRAVAIPPALLPVQGERLVQAFASDAPADAVPLDQVLVTAGRPVPKLLLPAGMRVRYAVQP